MKTRIERAGFRFHGAGLATLRAELQSMTNRVESDNCGARGDIEAEQFALLPTVQCPRCSRSGWLKDEPPDPALVVHAYYPDSGEVCDWCDLQTQSDD